MIFYYLNRAYRPTHLVPVLQMVLHLLHQSCHFTFSCMLTTLSIDCSVSQVCFTEANFVPRISAAWFINGGNVHAIFCQNHFSSILFFQIQILDEKHILLEECSWVDVKKRMLTTKSQNVTWSKYANLWEKSVFTPCADNPKWWEFDEEKVLLHFCEAVIISQSVILLSCSQQENMLYSVK